MTTPDRLDALAALRSLDNDWHPVSTRTCPTCDPIAKLLGEPFGCARYRIEHPGARHTYSPPPRRSLVAENKALREALERSVGYHHPNGSRCFGLTDAEHAALHREDGA